MRYHRIMLIVFAVVFLINAAGTLAGLLGHNHLEQVNAAVAAFTFLMMCSHANALRELRKARYYRQVMDLAQRRAAWGSAVARLEREIYGETYNHDRSYLPGYGERS